LAVTMEAPDGPVLRLRMAGWVSAAQATKADNESRDKVSKLEDEAAEIIRKRAAQKKQRYRMRRRGKTADPRDGNRPQLIQIWVCDP
jgi:hypothetical protein